MVKTRNANRIVRFSINKTCFMCSKTLESKMELCGHCIGRLKTICTSNEDPVDRGLADAVKIGRAVRRRLRVKRLARDICRDHGSFKKSVA